jgi:hypothetical protein
LDYSPQIDKFRSEAIFFMKEYSDVVKTILARPRNGSGGGIPLTRGEVAMLFLDGHAGDGPELLDIRSQGYGDDYDWDGLTVEDVIEDENTAFVWESGSRSNCGLKPAAYRLADCRNARHEILVA